MCCVFASSVLSKTGQGEEISDANFLSVCCLLDAKHTQTHETVAEQMSPACCLLSVVRDITTEVFIHFLPDLGEHAA